MFSHILVPLDGSELAESALPVAATIARATGSSLLLLRVVIPTPPSAFSTPEPLVFRQDVSDVEYQQAAAYLQRHAEAKELYGIAVQTHIMTGTPPQRILDCIETENIDLVVLCNRGATGLKRWALGSVALKILRHSRAPVLVLQASAGVPSLQLPGGQRPVRVLVALDGSMLAEESLVPAAVLATALSMPEKGELHLVRVIPVPEPANAVEALSGARQLDFAEAQTSLQVAVESLQGRENLTMTTSVVEDRDVADALIRMAEAGVSATAETRAACDVIALATHGRSGPARWAMGSIAERVLDGTRFPLLVVHPRLSGQQPQEAPATSASTMLEARKDG
jgi:nucleotide-binding universal stress UspA family protein